MRQSNLMAQRLVALCLAGLMLFYSPLIDLFNRSVELSGLPLLHVYLFGVWAILIGLMAWIIERHKQ